MHIDYFTWLPDIVDKLIVKHHVSQDEVENIFFNRPMFRFVENGYMHGEDVHGEDVYAALGQTDAGRYLIVFFIRKPDHGALIISARDMDRKERRLYETEVSRFFCSRGRQISQAKPASRAQTKKLNDFSMPVNKRFAPTY